MLGKMKEIESSMIFVNFMTGLTALLLTLLLFSIGNVESQNVINEEIQKTKGLFALSYAESIFVIFFVFFGFFIHGFRYLGFDYYRKVYDREKAKGKYSLYRRFLFHTFRDGTTIEKLLKEKRDYGQSHTYAWVRNSQNLPIDIWRYASAVDNRHPNANVYRFYYHSEVFQCLDTLFLMMIPVSVFVLVRYILTVSPMEISKIIFLGVYIFSMFFFHFLSKGISKAFDRRFFLDIEIGLMDCPDVDVS